MKLAANMTVNVTVAFVNANGGPAEVQGEVSWESSDTNVATVVASTTDSKHAAVTAGPSAGECEIFATGDADLGEGVSEVEAVLAVVVIARGVAIGGEITPDVGPTGPHADNSLPGPSGGIDNTLPGASRPVDPDHGIEEGGKPGRPDQSLPEHGEPKS